MISCRGGAGIAAGCTRDYGGRPACREGPAVLFLAEEGRNTHGITDLSWRVEQRAADAEAGRHETKIYQP